LDVFLFLHVSVQPHNTCEDICRQNPYDVNREREREREREKKIKKIKKIIIIKKKRRSKNKSLNQKLAGSKESEETADSKSRSQQ